MNDLRRFENEEKEEPPSAGRRGTSHKEMKFVMEDMYAQEEANRKAFKKMQIKKRDTFKIKTNAKYKCVDDGSEDENQQSKSNIGDDGQ